MAVSNSVLELARGLKSQYGAGLPELLFKRLHLALRKLMWNLSVEVYEMGDKDEKEG